MTLVVSPNRAWGSQKGAHDGCEWNPIERRGAWHTDAHFQSTLAVIVVGSNIQYRLCATCANLPQFAARIRWPIRRSTQKCDEPGGMR